MVGRPSATLRAGTSTPRAHSSPLRSYDISLRELLLTDSQRNFHDDFRENNPQQNLGAMA